jgi:hypothetical protein
VTRLRSPAALVAVGFALLLCAWVVATRPFTGPDEASHYLRALNIANGHLLGPRIRYPLLDTLKPLEQRFVQSDTRGVTVPSNLAPPDVNCVDGRPDTSGSCVEASPTGDYYPPAYVLPALAIKLSSQATTALWTARFLSALLCLAFIAAAIAALWDRTSSSLIGLFLAITPMALFVSSILNPSGLSIAASLATAASALGITRRPAGAPLWVWLVLIVSGVFTALSFQAGPAFLIADLALGAGFLGSAGLRELAARARARLVVCVCALVAALILWFVYGHVSGASHSHLGFTPVIHSLRTGVHELGLALRDAVGNFGSLTLQLPLAARLIWWLLVLALVAAALWLGRARDRALMVLVVALALAFPVLSYAWVYRYSGFALQGRQVLPILMLIPLAAGEIVHRRLDTRATPALGWALLGGIAAAAVLQAYAWGYDASVTTGGPGNPPFYSTTTYSPPLGWAFWIVVVALGIAAMLGFVAVEALRGFRPRTAPSG